MSENDVPIHFWRNADPVRSFCGQNYTNRTTNHLPSVTCEDCKRLLKVKK